MTCLLTYCTNSYCVGWSRNYIINNSNNFYFSMMQFGVIYLLYKFLREYVASDIEFTIIQLGAKI